jgi:hypothetical protein
MKYDRFLHCYKLTKPLAGDPPMMRDTMAKKGIMQLKIGVYNNGVYTIVSRDEASALLALVESVFEGMAGKIDIFAVDWMGRIFATDATTLDATGLNIVTCFDLAEPNGFYTDANFDDFHNKVAVDRQESLFNMDQYEEWIKGNASPSDGVSCVGYKIPLFLGGEDAVENQELSDRSVYLHILAEMHRSMTTDSTESK